MTGPKAGGVWGAGGERSMNGADQGRLGLQARANAVRGGGGQLELVVNSGGRRQRPDKILRQGALGRCLGGGMAWAFSQSASAGR